MAKVKVRYIGNRDIRRDNICKTLAIWTKAKPVAEVDEDTAARLFLYPTVWVPDDPNHPMSRPVTPEPETEVPAGENQEGDEGGEEVPADPDGAEGEANGGPVTAEEIADAIANTLDPDDFTVEGKPRVASLREVFEGREVTTDAIKAGWELAKPGEE